MQPCRLSVLIVTWNVRDLVCACLAAIERTASGITYEVIVVDNDSTDGTVEEIRWRFPAVTVLPNTENIGFPAANNQALERASGEYVLFLNPDTEVGADTLRGCMAVLDSNTDVAVVGCKLVLEDGTIQRECARRPYLLRHLAAELLYLHMLFPDSRLFGDHLMGYWDHEGERDVEAISGAFMMARRHVVEQVGGLPEEVFMYHEDLAFCLRVRREGWRIRYAGQYTTLHRWRASSGKSTAALSLLEGEAKVRLVREAEGLGAGVAARGLFALRCASRTVVGGAASLLLGRTALPRSYPRVFDWRTHALQFTWAVAPRLVSSRIPVTPAERGGPGAGRRAARSA